jgi:hypothetical protein
MAKVTITKRIEYDVKYLYVVANVRYWEDADINGVSDVNGTLTPCKEGPLWCPIIDVDSGQITNWKQGTTASIHFKVCDEGEYTLKDVNRTTITSYAGYVPNMMSPAEPGYGDYIIMNIDENGYIDSWKFTPWVFED